MRPTEEKNDRLNVSTTGWYQQEKYAKYDKKQNYSGLNWTKTIGNITLTWRRDYWTLAVD